MRILGHIHTFNDEDVIDRSLEALLDQSQPLDEILIVDNGSTDGTLRRSFPAGVTVIRHEDNRGTSGAVITGMQYALDKRYDWIWLFDADSAPRKDALEKLVQLYQSFPRDLQSETWLVASLPVQVATRAPHYGLIFTPTKFTEVRPDPGQPFFECDVAIWTGSLYKLAAVAKVGLPCADYVLDGGEREYDHRGKGLRYRAFMHQSSIVDHNIRAEQRIRLHRLGPLTFWVTYFSPIRCYYLFRNTLYFWLYEYRDRNVRCFLHEVSWLSTYAAKLLLLTRWTELLACVRGSWDGLCKNMHHRY
jgi:glycosyltransferase involved in cell wall biosynthesis